MYCVMRKSLFVVLLGVMLVFPLEIFAKTGVGVGLGKIQVDTPMKAGGIYDLPDLPVLNTGDETTSYEVTVEFHENIPEMWPERSWFRFDPTTFQLEKGGVQQVKVLLVLPPKTPPGKYFAYLEAHPVDKSEVGESQVGIAAASKLYFTVAPSNIFSAWYYRFVSLYSRYHPWDTIVLSVIGTLILVRFLGKRFKIQIAKK